MSDEEDDNKADAEEEEQPEPEEDSALVVVSSSVEETLLQEVVQVPPSCNGSGGINSSTATATATAPAPATAELNIVQDAVVTDALGRTGTYTGMVIDPEASIKIPHDDSGTAVMVYDAGGCGVTRYKGGWQHGHWQSLGEEQTCRIEYATGDVYTGRVAQSVRTGSAGTLQWKDGRKYVGEWRDGERHGHGVYEWPHAKYEGDFWHNQRQGHGVYESRTDSMHLLYTGEWQNNQYHGQGRYEITTTTTAADSQEQTKVFVGRFADGKPVPEEFIEPEGASQQLQPEDTTDNTSAISVVTNQPWFDRGVPAVYRGLWLHNKHKPHGNGVADYQLGAVQSYEGCFHHGLYHGEGRLVYRESGDCYTGSFQQGERHGHGTYKWSDGRQYSGEWHKNVRGGRGVFTWPSTGDRYEGEFEQGQRHGQGHFVFGESGASYKGEWLQGLYHGRGRTVDATGAVYEGDFVNGQRHGQGVEYDPTGKLVYEGLWKEGYRASEVEDSEEAQLEEEKKDELVATTFDQPEEEEKKKECSVSVERLEIEDHHQTTPTIPPPPPLAPPPATPPPPPPPPPSEHLMHMASHQRSFASNSDDASNITNPNILRNWYQPPPAKPSPIAGDDHNCRAVVDQAVTDQLECPGLYTGIVDAKGRPHGVGRLVYSDGKRVHEGFWIHGMKQGHGRCLFYPQQDFHEGEYSNNLRHGEGLYQWKDGRKYVGNYEYDFRHGKGVFTYPNGERYDG